MSTSRPPCVALFTILALTLSSWPMQALDRASLTGPPTIVVDGSTCTLDDAIRAANSGTTIGGCVGSPGMDVLSLEADVTLTMADPIDSSDLGGAHAGLPDVTSEIAIVAGAGTTIQRDSTLGCSAATASSFRLFNVTAAGSLHLFDLTLRGGCVAPASGIVPEGGAIHVAGGLLELSDVTLEDNEVHALETDGFDVDAGGGGAVFCRDGSMPSISGSTFRNNLARGVDGQAVPSPAAGGAGNFENCTVGVFSDTLFETNSAIGSSDLDKSADGGALYIDESTVERLTRVTFLDNLAQGGSDSNAGSSSRARGGAVVFHSSTIGLIETSTFLGNRAQAGHSAASTGAFGEGGAIAFESTDVTEIASCLFEANQAIGGNAGGLSSPGNANAGAVQLTGGSDLAHLHDSWLHGNQARSGTKIGVSGGTTARGGGLVLEGGSRIDLIERVTFSENLALGGAASVARAQGGALYASEIIERMEGCTFYGNRAVGGTDNDPGETGEEGVGGAIYTDGPTVIDLVANTFAHNEAQAGPGEAGSGEAKAGAIFINPASGATRMVGNLFTGNRVLLADGTATLEDCREDDVTHQVSLGFNLVEAPGSCVFAATGDQVGVATTLHGPANWGCQTLLANGSCVPTLAIDQSSPAADTGSCSVAVIANDAREEPRPFDLLALANVDDGCDIGAFEAVDTDGDGFTEATDCAPEDPGSHTVDLCGLCGGDNSTCLLFADGFESGDTSAWSF